MTIICRFGLIAIVLCSVAIASGCRETPRHGGPYLSDTVSLGSGGGITGTYSGYRLVGNGELWFWVTDIRGRDSSALLATLGADTTNYLIARLRFIGFTSIDFNAPGNLTRVLSLSSPDATNTVRWGDLTQKAPDEVVRYFDETMTLIRGRIGK
jgi:hypothetical protein